MIAPVRETFCFGDFELDLGAYRAAPRRTPREARPSADGLADPPARTPDATRDADRDRRTALDSRAISTDILDFRWRVLVIQAATGGYGRAALISDTVLPVYAGRPRDPLVRGSRLQTHGPAGSGGRLSVIMPPRRWKGTSRRPPIGWPQRGRGGRRPHVPSGLLEPRPLC